MEEQYANNFYNSLPLAEHLLRNNTFFYVAPSEKNRKGLPLEVLSEKLKKGGVIGRQKLKNVKIIKWKDRRDVLMISTKKITTLAWLMLQKKENSLKSLKNRC